ncbi:hypothetical protein Aperf_G00000086255 [Anoplocephala perfoliata]
MSYPKLDDAIIEMQKKLYRIECLKEARIKRGGKFYPFNIEPLPTERERTIKPMTDEDRALRKQWLEDQKLSPREPVDVPEFTRKNIFRRAYAGFFDGIAGVFRPILGQKGTAYLRKGLPLFLVPYLTLCALWYNIKYNPRGQPDFPNSPKLKHKFADEDFSERKIFLGDKLVTSGR